MCSQLYRLSWYTCTKSSHSLFWFFLFSGFCFWSQYGRFCPRVFIKSHILSGIILPWISRNRKWYWTLTVVPKHGNGMISALFWKAPIFFISILIAVPFFLSPKMHLKIFRNCKKQDNCSELRSKNNHQKFTPKIVGLDKEAYLAAVKRNNSFIREFYYWTFKLPPFCGDSTI